MPSSPFNQFMHRRKPSRTVDELPIVKAAAWAWYQHGSGSEGRPMREYDATRARPAHEPSRYKLEALRSAQDSPILGDSSHTDISLLDTYEIDRISRQLDYYIESSNADHYGDGGHRRIVSLPESEAIAGVLKDNKILRKKVKGFWLWPGVMCGSRNDVVVQAGGFGRGRQLEKRVAVVTVANCRPRATHA